MVVDIVVDMVVYLVSGCVDGLNILYLRAILKPNMVLISFAI
jgi:hypothetical protein